jgi:hypothetical protein
MSPFRSGKSQKVIGENIAEYHHGPSFKKIEEKHGKETADKVAVAAAESNARKTGGFRSRRKK